MPIVKLDYGGTQFETTVSAGTVVMELVRHFVPSFSFPCGGHHTCGKCRVKISGDPKCISSEGTSKPEDAWYLACSSKIQGNCTIHIPYSTHGQQIEQNFSATLIPGTPLYPGEYGAAVDIGTTTIVAYLFRRGETNPLAVCGESNAQRTFGSDVLARIVYCDQHSIQPLQTAICDQLGQMLIKLCSSAGIAPQELSGCCITGNTTMLHLLTGLNPHGISVSPFTPQSLFGEVTMLSFTGFPPLPCYLPPCISAYIGGDICCSILASNILHQNQTALLIDVGTNGEIVLCQNQTLTCCSTAAGPAFEGACISCGMQARTGAIGSVWAHDGALQYTVIGSTAPAIGICGSGLIDAVYAARQIGLLDRKGRPRKNCAGLPISDSGISLTRKDLNELLLAKAAIRAGIDTLLDTCDLCAEQIDTILLCGEFGSYLNVESAIGIGLLPACFSERTSSIGNAAGAGAAMVLQNRTNVQKLERIYQAASAVELSATPYFTKQYIASMFLP